jgi:iron(II)-dependent oxidoreductase
MHLTFQEYLAAQFLSRQWQSEAPDSLAKLVTDEWWREALLLTIGSLGAPTPFDQRRDFILKLCQMDASLPVALAAAELAASGLSDLADPEPILQNVTRKRLVELLTDPGIVEATPADRAAAGRALAVLGDDRDFDELVTIPTGPFLMGDNEDIDASPQHKLFLAQYKIGRYPVTNAQYRRFVEAKKIRWNWEDGWRTELANCPAIVVTWRDAQSFCDWQTDVWRAEGKITASEEVRLPTEAEWEKAARGEEGRAYPWGNRWDEAKCNSSDLGIGQSTPVGIFPNGASPYGCMDMAGNVLEWTISIWGLVTGHEAKKEFYYPYDSSDGRENIKDSDHVLRVLRGGSWCLSGVFARCTSRRWYSPDFRGGSRDSRGFRIVVSPISAF